MSVLHVLRNSNDRLAGRLIDSLQRLDDAGQALILIQDAVYASRTDIPAVACKEDVQARGIETALELVEYDRIVELIFEYDRVIVW